MQRRDVLIAIATSAMATAIAPAAWADGLNSIIKAKTIRIAVPQDFPPFGSLGSDMKLVGYDISMADLIAKELGVKLELVPVSSANRIPYLQTHKVDLVISTLGKNAERDKVIDFSKAYAPFYQGVFALKDIKITGPADLAGKTVGATRGAMEEEELTKIAPATTTIKRYEDNNATIAAFLSGQVDIIATGNIVAATIAERSTTRLLTPKFVIKNSPCFVGLNKDEPALMARINEIIDKAHAAGTLNAFCEKWLKAPMPETL